MNTSTQTASESKTRTRSLDSMPREIFGRYVAPAPVAAPVAFHKATVAERNYEAAYQAVLGGRASWLTSAPEPEPEPTEPDDMGERMLTEDEIQALDTVSAQAGAVALALESGTASVLPTVDGRGLTVAERTAINAARNDAEYRAGWFAADNADIFPFECGRVAAAVALRIVLARRPRPDGPDGWFDPEDTDTWFDQLEAESEEYARVWEMEREADEAINAGLASIRPDDAGEGLDDHERVAMRAAMRVALRHAYPQDGTDDEVDYEMLDVVAAAALAAVLALRPEADDVEPELEPEFIAPTFNLTFTATAALMPSLCGGSPDADELAETERQADLARRRADFLRYGNRVLRREPRGPWDLESSEMSQAGSCIGHRD